MSQYGYLSWCRMLYTLLFADVINSGLLHVEKIAEEYAKCDLTINISKTDCMTIGEKNE